MVVRYCQLPLNSFFLAEIIELSGNVFTSIIRSQGTNLSSRLVFHLCLEFPKLLNSFALGLQEEDPSLPREVINEEDIVKVPG
jgi:hypothetical protein